MTSELDELRSHLKRSKIGIYLILGFLVLLTYLLIIVNRQVSSEQSFIFQPKASEIIQSSGARFITSDLQGDEVMIEQSSDSLDTQESLVEDPPFSICGNCVSSVTRGIWKDDPSYDPKGCQARLSCTNGPPDISKIKNDPVYGSGVDGEIECLTRAEALRRGVRDDELVGGALGPNDVVCQYKNRSKHDECIASQYPSKTPRWDYLAAKICGCGFEKSPEGKISCDDGSQPRNTLIQVTRIPPAPITLQPR